MQIVHMQDQSYFTTAEVPEAVLEYRKNGQTVDFTRTYVPESDRGRGVAKELVLSGLEWAREAGLTAEASCWYAHKIMQAREA